MKWRYVLGGVGVYVTSTIGVLWYTSTPHAETREELEGFTPLEQVEAIFDKNAADYDKDTDREEWIIGVQSARKELVAKARGHVLEMAVGTGKNFAHYDWSQVRRVVGVDLSQGMLDVAKEKAREVVVKEADGDKERERELLGSVSLLKANAAQLPFPDNSFDTVVQTFGQCSYTSPVEVLLEMKRLVKPEGRIHLLEHGRSLKHQTWSKVLDKQAVGHARAWGCWNNRHILLQIKQAGLEVVSKDDRLLGTHYMIEAKKPAESDAETVADQQ